MPSRPIDDETRRSLDAMSYTDLVILHGEPVVHTLYAEPQGYWTQGDGRPSLADDDPAVMQAIGRCAAARVHRLSPVPGAIHPVECGWCAYPLDELLRACDWATFTSRYIVSELAIWEGPERSSYIRELRSGIYANPRWAQFHALPPAERRYRIESVRA